MTGTPAGASVPVRPPLVDESFSGTVHMTGELEERYEREAEIGEGGFGTIYRVRRLEDGAVLASKSAFCGRGRANERLEAEVSTWAAVSLPYHPSILQLVEVLSGERRINLLTELMDGGELMDAVERLPTLTEQCCRMVGLQVSCNW